jgi:hypothetical protein
LLKKTALHLCSLYPFTKPAKRARAHRLCRKSLLCYLPLALNLAHAGIDNLLLIRIHERRNISGAVALRGSKGLARSRLKSALGICELPASIRPSQYIGRFRSGRNTLSDRLPCPSYVRSVGSNALLRSGSNRSKLRLLEPGNLILWELLA